MLFAAWMASSSTGSARGAGAPPPFSAREAGARSDGETEDTAQLDRLCEKAIAAEKHGRYALAASIYKRTVEETLRLHGETFVCTYLMLKRSHQLYCQARLEGVPQEERTTLLTEAWAILSSSLPLIVRRMDDNTMLPGRGTAVELTFFK